MEFVIPTFLAAVGVAAIPLVLHLIFRRRVAQVVFPATRFIRVAAVRTARRRRFENLLLFILRTLLLALLAFGLAGPVLQRAGVVRGGSDVAVIIDNSPSMNAVDDGRARFAIAKSAVEEVLALLAEDDMVALVPTSPPASLEGAALTASRSDVRTRLAALSPSAARGSLAAALERSAAILANSSAPNRLVFCISDLQSNFVPEPDTLSDECRALLLTTPVILYNCSADPLRNVSIESVDVRSTGIVASPVEVVARVRARSSVEETLTASLILSGVTKAVRSVTVPAGGEADVYFPTVLDAPGVFAGVVEVDAKDSFGDDDRRHFALIARDRLKALLVARDRREPDYRDDLFFLSRAMDPFIGRELPGESPFEISTTTYDRAGSLESYDIALVVMREGFSLLAPRLEDFLRTGGSVVLFAAAGEALAAEQPQWLPAVLVGPASADRARGESFTVTSIDTESDALAAFSDEPSALYNTIAVYEHWLSRPGKASRVLATFNTGSPLVVEGAAGGGAVALFTTAPLVRSSTLVSSKFFLPFLHEISFHLVSAARGSRDVIAGQGVDLAEGTSAAPPVVTDPGGFSRVVERGDDGSYVYDGTWDTGCYRVSYGDGRQSGGLSVNLDPVESDLSTLDESAAGRALAAQRVLVADSADGLDRALASLAGGLALGDALLYIVLFIAIFEIVAANRSRSRTTEA
ncbi:MAG: BatA domain-containing protein [Planctomycetota bacterium]|jgi:hypothetical protein